MPGAWVFATCVGWGLSFGWTHDRLRRAVTSHQSPVASRRRFMLRLGAATLCTTAASAIVGALAGRWGRTATGPRWSDDHVLPNAGSPVAPVRGTRAEFTRLEDHYRIDTDTRAPEIDADRWRLVVGGLVDQSRSFTLAELRALPATHQFITLSCISNPVGGDLISTTRWSGVSLQQLLPSLGLRPSATHLRVTSADGFLRSRRARHDSIGSPRHAGVRLGRRAVVHRARVSASTLHARSLRNETAEMDGLARRPRPLGARILGGARVGPGGPRDDDCGRRCRLYAAETSSKSEVSPTPVPAGFSESKCARTRGSGSRPKSASRCPVRPGWSGAPSSGCPATSTGFQVRAVDLYVTVDRTERPAEGGRYMAWRLVYHLAHETNHPARHTRHGRQPLARRQGVSAAARERAEGRRSRKAQGQPLDVERRRREHRRVRPVRRHHRGRHEEPGLGPADPRRDQEDQHQADHDRHQHAHARRSRQRQRRVPDDGRDHRAGKHQGQHDGDARPHGHRRRTARRRTSSSRTTAAACRRGRTRTP